MKIHYQKGLHSLRIIVKPGKPKKRGRKPVTKCNRLKKRYWIRTYNPKTQEQGTREITKAEFDKFMKKADNDLKYLERLIFNTKPGVGRAKKKVR
jgi:hypothetical protein